MIEIIYQTLTKFGYTHPLHPTLTHLPIGMVMGVFFFVLVALIFRRANLAQTARHCSVLALIAAVPTALLGLMDWQHFYGGSLLFPIKMKLVLAGILIVFLLLAVISGFLGETFSKTVISLYVLCLISVIGLGYFGGELVFGRPSTPDTVSLEKKEDPLVIKGAQAFNQDCAACHYTDRQDFKVGPGLKDLFLQKTLYKSNLPVTDENVRKQLTDPFESMPAYNDLPDETLDALMAYLKTL